MSVNQGSIATTTQSLPSFASTFNSRSLANMSNGNNSLPPIQTRLPPLETRRLNTPPNRDASENGHIPKTNARKRPHNDLTSNNRDEDTSGSDRSPPLVHIKEEEEVEMKDSRSPPRSESHTHTRPLPDTEGAPSPSFLGPTPSKKRRVTISGAPHPLNTDVRAPVDQTNSTPISPVVMGFTINRDNPMALEQMKSALNVKQQQKALIEQRRGSVVGVTSPSTVTTNPVLPSPVPASKQSRPSRRSPNVPAAGGPRRPPPPPASANPVSQPARPPSPVPLVVQTQKPAPVPALTSASSLSTPPISFARRRAEQLGSHKKKPADIVISPREAQTSEQLAPVIQSAPPGQLAFGKVPMVLPRLPAVMGGGEPLRRIPGHVPPTPTRLAMQRNPPSNGPVQNLTSIATNPPLTNRSPPGTSVPIASTLVPKTPGFQLGASPQDKSAFLAPFEVFYDALNDSKQLKTWLGEQLQRSNAMMQQLTQQQERLNEVVESLVEKRTAGIRSEMASLHRRVEELEDALRVAASGRRLSVDYSNSKKSRTPLRNEVSTGPAENYTFPPLHDSQRRRVDFEPASSPRMIPERDSHPPIREPNGSPAPDMLRTNSASRAEHARSVRVASPPRTVSSSRTPYNIQSPPQASLESSGGHKSDRPSLSRQSSSHGPPPSSADSQHSLPSSPPHRRTSGSRRNSVVMAPPDAPGERDD